DKEVQVHEETNHPFIVPDIAKRIDMDQGADAGDNEQHHCGQGIDLKGKLDLKGARFDPSVDGIPKYSGGWKKPKNIQGDCEGSQNRGTREPASGLSSKASAEKLIDQARQQWNQRHPADQVDGCNGLGRGYHFSNCIS